MRGIIFNANVYLASISVGKTTYLFEMLVPPVAFVFYVFGLVRSKTFSTHVVPEIRRVVSKTGVFTHGKIRRKRLRGDEARPGGGETSGGSLRSSRQAVACHPFTRSWATMPPEAPPPPGLLCHMVFTDNHFHAM